MAVEPSLQQIPTYVSLPTDVGNGSLPRAISYEYLEYDIHGNLDVSSPLKGAIYSAVFDATNATNSGLAPSCPTGNCTWPTHSSLGVCSACANLTDRILHTGYDGKPWPGVLRLANGADILSDSEQISGTDYMTANTYSSMAFPKSANSSILDVTYMYMQSSMDLNASVANTRAFECMLYFCVKTYQAVMVNGVLEETVESTWPPTDREVVQPAPIMPMVECIGPNGKQYTGPADQCPYYNGTEKFTLQPPGQRELTFTVNSFLYNMLRIWIGTLIRFNYRPISQDGTVALRHITDDLSGAFYDSQRKSLGSITVKNGTKGLNMPEPDDVFERIATAMTNHMRSVVMASEAVLGTAHTSQTTVQARWAWAIFPIALLMTTFAYVLATVFLSVQKRIPMWKSSSLAALLHGLDAHCSDQITAEKLGDMETNARAFSMGLSTNATRWELKGSRV